MPVATHEIDLRGLSGAIFWLILSALIFYVIGFSTVGWAKVNNYWVGLWQVCAHTTDAYTAGVPTAFTVEYLQHFCNILKCNLRFQGIK